MKRQTLALKAPWQEEIRTPDSSLWKTQLWDQQFAHLLQQEGITCWRRIGFRSNPESLRTEWHRHPGVEILYCEKGEGIFNLGRDRLPYSAGSLVLFDPQIPHQVCMKDVYVRWNLCFMPDAVGAEASLHSRLVETLGSRGGARHVCLAQIKAADRPRLHSLFSDMEQEASERRHGFELILALRLSEFFLLFQRYLTESAASPQAKAQHVQEPRFYEILTYIENQLSTDISVQSIARHFHISQSYLYRLMQAAIGQSPSQYIVGRRVLRARRLLAGSSLSIAEIANAVGITSPSHFCSLFKKCTGHTPREYRARCAMPINVGSAENAN